MQLTNVFIVAVLMAGAAWLGLAAWIVGDRLLYDRRDGRIARDAELLATGTLDPGRCSWRRLWAVADGGSPLASPIAARELVSRGSSRLLRSARGHGFGRTHALRVLARGGSPKALEELRHARSGGNPDVIAATVAIAGELDSAESDAFLLDVLIEGDNPRSRTADQISRGERVVPALLELTAHADPRVRYWALMLLGGADPQPKILAAALDAAGDSDAQVRGAAARALGAYEPGDVKLGLRRLISDDVFFVRAHAARAIGDSGSESLAPAVGELLADENWWVRAAAKESLAKLGESGLEAAAAMLDSEDAFARDGAAETILALNLAAPSGHEVETALLEKAAS